MNDSPKILIPGILLIGFVFLLLTILAATFNQVNTNQIELAEAERYQAIFEQQHSSPEDYQTMSESLKAAYAVDWQIFLRDFSTMDGANSRGEAGIPATDLKLKASTLAQPVTLASEVYQQVLTGEAKLLPLQLPASNIQPYRSIYSFPIYSESGDIIGVAQTLWDRSPRSAIQRNKLLLNLATTGAVLLIGIIGLLRISRRALAPLTVLAENSSWISSGQYGLIQPVKADGTLAVLGDNLNKIGDRMHALEANLDALVAERTHDLEKRNQQIQTAAQIASQIAAPQSLDSLLYTTANSIRERFAYYHVGVFLVDDQKQNAVLLAATGEPGNLLVKSGHKLRIGQSGIVGMATATGEPRIAADVTQDPAHYRNPILPYTRAEMALPLKAGGEVIGAIDVQSTEVGAFSQDDVSILQTLADHLAVAIENTRLVEKLQISIEETNWLYRRQVEAAWIHSTEQSQNTGYQYDRMRVMPAHTSLPVNVIQQLHNGQVVLEEGTSGATPSDNHPFESLLLVPLTLHRQLIGVIGIEQSQPDHHWTVDELAIVQAAADQVSLTIENARLLEETHQRADRERLAGQITAQLRSSNDPQQILQTAVSELKHALHVQKAQVLITPHHKNAVESLSPDSILSSSVPGGGNGQPNNGR